MNEAIAMRKPQRPSKKKKKGKVPNSTKPKHSKPIEAGLDESLSREGEDINILDDDITTGRKKQNNDDT